MTAPELFNQHTVRVSFKSTKTYTSPAIQSFLPFGLYSPEP